MSDDELHNQLEELGRMIDSLPNVTALVRELAGARSEIGRLNERIRSGMEAHNADRVRADMMWRERDEARAQLAKAIAQVAAAVDTNEATGLYARQIAMEEAALALDGPNPGNYPSHDAALIRALAPLPPSILPVPREAVEAAKEAMEHVIRSSRLVDLDLVRRALALIQGLLK